MIDFLQRDAVSAWRRFDRLAVFVCLLLLVLLPWFSGCGGFSVRSFLRFLGRNLRRFETTLLLELMEPFQRSPSGWLVRALPFVRIFLHD
jgi:hypothetical protein